MITEQNMNHLDSARLTVLHLARGASAHRMPRFFVILGSTQIVLSTIAGTGKMARVVGKRVHTVLIDEAGCVEEIAMSPILKLQPKNIVLIGEHLYKIL